MNNRDALTHEIARILRDKKEAFTDINRTATNAGRTEDWANRERAKVVARELDDVGVEADIQRYKE